jgi:hypothetical protein
VGVLVKLSVKATDKESPFKAKFPKISEAKMKEGIFIGPQITRLFEDKDLSTKLCCTKRRAWKAFENICKNFLSTGKEENSSEILGELISSYSVMGCNMSLKLHFLHS